jgi:hypothetical protein
MKFLTSVGASRRRRAALTATSESVASTVKLSAVVEKYMMKIKIFPADKVFSRYIRSRDRKCVRCGSRVEFNEKGLPVSHQNSHYWGRRNWSVRYDPENCDTLCMFCHFKWGSDQRRDYEAFKRKQLGETAYRKLEIRSQMYAKRDHKLALLYVKELLKTPPLTNLT